MKKKLLILTLFPLFFCKDTLTIQQPQYSLIAWATPIAAACLGGIYWKLTRTPAPLPIKPETLNITCLTPSPSGEGEVTRKDDHWKVSREIPGSKNLLYYLHGHNTPRLLYDLYCPKKLDTLKGPKRLIERKIIPSSFSAVSFEFPDSRAHTNLGQTLDTDCFQAIYDAAPAAAGQKRIVLGACRGGTVAVRSACAGKKFDALILDSPLLSTQGFINSANHYLPGGSLIFQAMLSTIFPTFKVSEDTLLNEVEQSTNLSMPIFVAYLKDDPVVTKESIRKFINSLKALGNRNVYLLLLDDKSLEHGKLHRSDTFVQVVNAFLKKHGFDHDTSLAKTGSAYLAHAQQNATSNDEAQWHWIEN